MTSPKPAENISPSHSKSPSRPTSEQVPGQSMQNSLPTSQRINAEAHVMPQETELLHKVTPDDLFPRMLAAFEHVQEIVERGYKGTSHDVGRPSSKVEITDVHQDSMFLRKGDEHRIVSTLGKEGRHKRRKTHEDPQADVSHTFNNGWVGKRASSSILPFSNGPYNPPRKLGHPTPSPLTTWQMPTPIPTHPSHAIRKSLAVPLIAGSDIGTVSASEAFLKGYIEGQAKDKQQGMLWGNLEYRRSLA